MAHQGPGDAACGVGMLCDRCAGTEDACVSTEPQMASVECQTDLPVPGHEDPAEEVPEQLQRLSVQFQEQHVEFEDQVLFVRIPPPPPLPCFFFKPAISRRQG